MNVLHVIFPWLSASVLNSSRSRFGLMERLPRYQNQHLNPATHSLGNLVDVVLELQQRLDVIEAYLEPLQKIGEPVDNTVTPPK